MSVTRSTRLTYAGLNLLAKGQTGTEIHFTRVIMGDGRLTEGQDIRQLTGLVNPLLTLPIKTVSVTGVGTTVMEAELKNTHLAAGFFAREVGIFAKEGTEGDEILYAYRNTADDSEYIPAGGGSEVWNLLYDIVTVVDQAENITANIDGSVAYVTKLDYNEHVDSTNPHKEFLQIGNEVTTAQVINCDVRQAGDKLNHISIDNLRLQVLGDTSTIPVLNSRVRQLERENANLALRLEAEGMMPDCNMLLAENFENPDSVDRFEVDVTSCAAGDDSIDVVSNYGFIVGSWYWITDGVHAEYVQVKSVIKNGSVYRVILTKPLTETYQIEQTKIYRTTA
ncbi:MAG: phage tail protein, partial [Veillonellaceae bacterium]|nr:phage tail protein [Veillonellaceae bacterium]